MFPRRVLTVLTAEVIWMKKRKRDTEIETEGAKRKQLSLARIGIQNEKELTEMEKNQKGMNWKANGNPIWFEVHIWYS